MKKAILKTSGMLLVVGLAFTAMLFGCKHKAEPKSKAETKTEKVTITILGDSNVKSIEPEPFTVAKGSKWGDIKGNVNVTYNEGYGAAGFKLENASGQDLTDDYAFNESKTVFAVSKQMVITITVKGDERTDISSGAFIKVGYDKTWQQIKSDVERNVLLKSEWRGGDYAIYDWRLDGETGEKLTDGYKVKTDITVYAVTNYTKFYIGGTSIISVSGYTGGSPKGKIIIPENITSIGLGAFSGCSGLKSVTFPASLTSIGQSAFDGCTGITSVSFPESLTSIGGNAFLGCTGLMSVSFPASLTSIGESAFRSCSGLASVTVDVGNSTYKAVDNVVYTKDGTTLVFAAGGLTSVNILPSVTSIGSCAFYGCTGITSVSFPASLTSIGGCAFERCTGLTSVSLSSCTSLTSIGGNAFYRCTGITSVSFPASLTSIGNYAFYGCDNLTSATFADAAGWAVYNDYKYKNKATDIEQSDLVNPATAVNYLLHTYREKYWKKN